MSGKLKGWLWPNEEARVNQKIGKPRVCFGPAWQKSRLVYESKNQELPACVPRHGEIHEGLAKSIIRKLSNE